MYRLDVFPGGPFDFELHSLFRSYYNVCVCVCMGVRVRLRESEYNLTILVGTFVPLSTSLTSAQRSGKIWRKLEMRFKIPSGPRDKLSGQCLPHVTGMTTSLDSDTNTQVLCGLEQRQS